MEYVKDHPIIFVLAGIVIAAVLAQAIFFLIRAIKRAKEKGMNMAVVRKTIVTSVLFTIAPAVSILIAIISLVPKLGVALPWLRLSVIGSLSYESIAAGRNVALVSDAGTPGISDPGFLLVRTCVEQGIEVETLPGATACIPALVQSGFPCDRFCFEGFLPQKKGRQTRIEALKSENRTMIFYESPHRVVKALQQFAEAFGEERQCSACREISKLHEESVRGTLAEVLAHFMENEPRISPGIPA